jgi:hypothetical protein
MVDKLERAVANLGRYYGAISRDAFVSLLANKDRSLPAGLVAPDLSSVSKVGRAILDVTEGGFTTPQLITYVNTLSQGASPEEKSEIFKAVKICYEPMGSDDSNAKIILSSETPVVINGRNRQGVIRRGDQSGPFSIRSVIGAPESSNINSTPGAPGPDETTFSVIQVFSPRITVSNRDMGALTLFLNAIPTIEMSRAVPFIDIVLLQKSDPIAKDDTGKNRVRSLSLGQFLLGNKPVSLGNAEGSYVGAIDSEIQTLQQRFPEFVNSTTQQSDGLSTAGMELFTSPQTLVSANEFHQEGDEIAGSDQASRDARALRGSPVIDRFRPLMTLKSLSINIAPTSGLMSYKSGKLSLTLHDRSRLTDVASFVTPGKYQNVHMQIEYGWAHPDSRPQESPSFADPTNLFADLIGSLRVKEKYAVINPSLSFGDSGQVDIEIPLAMLGSRAAQQVHIALDPSTKSAIDEVKRLTDLIEVIRNRLDSTTITSLFGSGDVIGSLSSANSILGMSDEVKKSLRRVQIAANQSGNRSPSLRELGSALGSLIGPPSPTAAGISPGSAAGILGSSIKNVIQNKMRLLRETSDPFICPIENLLTEPQVRARQPKYVSLGKIISVFVGSSISSSDYYKDFQVIFYNFNEKASFMQNINIASMPIDIDDFQKILEDELDKLINMPISMFMEFLSTYFISDSGAFAYGFSSLYERRSGEQNAERQVAQSYRDNPPGLFAKEQEILFRAYGRLFGDSGGDLEFKMPTVQMYLETVPIKTTDGRLTSDTILRAHIFDSQSSTHVTPQRLLQAANSDKIGLINASAHELMTNSNQVTSDGEPSTSSTQLIRSNASLALRTNIQDAVSAGLLEVYPPVSTAGGTPKHRLRGGLPALKKFLMSTMPSVRYGEGNSGIRSAKLTSIQDSALSTIQILRRGKNSESPVGDRERGIPLQILPVECTLETIGCPLWSFAQQLFIDFGTGTTADAIYGVVGVEHTLSAGEFKSSVKLTPISSYASYFSLFNNIDQAISAMEAQDPKAFRAADTAITSARRGAAGAARTRRQQREREAAEQRRQENAASSATVSNARDWGLYRQSGVQTSPTPAEAALSSFISEAYAEPIARNNSRRERIAQIDSEIIANRRLANSGMSGSGLAYYKVKELEDERVLITQAMEPES